MIRISLCKHILMSNFLIASATFKLCPYGSVWALFQTQLTFKVFNVKILGIKSTTNMAVLCFLLYWRNSRKLVNLLNLHSQNQKLARNNVKTSKHPVLDFSRNDHQLDDNRFHKVFTFQKKKQHR